MTLNLFLTLIEQRVFNNIQLNTGSVQHSEVLGNVLEGFVLFLNHSNILKFKFPN